MLTFCRLPGESKQRKIITALNLSIYRLDFSARIRESGGSERAIVIEIQKSKFMGENMRFRKYLGKQYMNGNFFQWITGGYTSRGHNR